MNSLILAAALSNAIAFNVSQQGEMVTVTPQVTVTQSCLCQINVQTVREGQGGTSNIQQNKTLNLPANQPVDLAQLRLTMGAHDTVRIVVTLTDGQALHLSAQWPSGQKT